MIELIALQEARDNNPVSYTVKQNGRAIPDAISLTAGAVHAFFEHIRRQQLGIPNPAISIMLSQHLSGLVQTHDFLKCAPVRIDAAEMLAQVGADFTVSWNRQLKAETPYSSQGNPLMVVQYATRIKAAGEERNVRIRVPYLAYTELSQRVSDPWSHLASGVEKAFETRLKHPRLVPGDGELVELSSEEVLG